MCGRTCSSSPASSRSSASVRASSPPTPGAASVIVALVTFERLCSIASMSTATSAITSARTSGTPPPSAS
eukprot:scaffold26892_cov48-Phaeocystis_antarctica.AAC.1